MTTLLRMLFHSIAGAVSISSALDYETQTNHTLIIGVSDKGTPTPRVTTVQLTVNVNPINENAPTFEPSNSYGTLSVAEDAVIGKKIYFVYVI